MQVNMTVNGEQVTADVEPRLLLVHFLRDQLRLTGTHWGCDTSNCGTCVVDVDGIVRPPLLPILGRKSFPVRHEVADMPDRGLDVVIRAQKASDRPRFCRRLNNDEFVCHE